MAKGGSKKANLVKLNIKSTEDAKPKKTDHKYISVNLELLPGTLSFDALTDIQEVLKPYLLKYETLVAPRDRAVPLLYIFPAEATYDDLLAMKEELEVFGKTIVQKTIGAIEKLVWMKLDKLILEYYHHETNYVGEDKPAYTHKNTPEFKLPSEKKNTSDAEDKNNNEVTEKENVKEEPKKKKNPSDGDRVGNYEEDNFIFTLS